MALGINQIAGDRRAVHRAAARRAAGRGRLAGGVLGERARSASSARCGRTGACARSRAAPGGRIDWSGNVTFAVGLSAILVAITYGIQPYGGHPTGLDEPVRSSPACSAALLLLVAFVRHRDGASPSRCSRLGLFRIRAFAAGNVAACSASIARGGLQFMLVIWLQGIWLPLHGYDFESHAAVGGHLHAAADRRASWSPARSPATCPTGSAHAAFATAGLLVFGASFVGLMLLPVDFPYWAFALLILLNGVGSGLFAAPNTSAIMSERPGRSAASRPACARRSRTPAPSLSIGIFFSLMIVGPGRQPPDDADRRSRAQGVPAARGRAGRRTATGERRCSRRSSATTRSSTCSGPSGALATLTPAQNAVLTGQAVLPGPDLRARSTTG